MQSSCRTSPNLTFYCLNKQSSALPFAFKVFTQHIIKFCKQDRNRGLIKKRKEKKGKLTAFRPMRLATFPFKIPPIIPPTVTIDTKTEY